MSKRPGASTKLEKDGCEYDFAHPFFAQERPGRAFGAGKGGGVLARLDRAGVRSTLKAPQPFRDRSMTDPQTPPEEKKVGIGAYIALLFAIVIFSGVFYKMPEAYKWLGAFDFTTLIGHYGTIKGAGGNFVGAGGDSARAGFLFALSLFPGVMLAMGIIEVLSHYGALRAAQVLMTPLLKPMLGVPGYTGLALITDLQSTDGGAALTRALYDEKRITRKNLVTICAWQYAGAGCISNYYTTVSALFSFFTVAVWVPMVVILVLKFVGGMLIRTILGTVYKKDFEDEQY